MAIYSWFIVVVNHRKYSVKLEKYVEDIHRHILYMNILILDTKHICVLAAVSLAINS